MLTNGMQQQLSLLLMKDAAILNSEAGVLKFSQTFQVTILIS